MRGHQKRRRGKLAGRTGRGQPKKRLPRVRRWSDGGGAMGAAQGAQQQASCRGRRRWMLAVAVAMLVVGVGVGA